MTRSTRVVEVTATLAVLGAIGGAISGAGVLAVLIVIENGFGVLFTRQVGILVPGALVGATVGIFAGPALAWGILRRVTLGKAILATSLGTIIGAALGELLWPLNPYSPQGIPGLILGL